jgi:hypothetical protein
MSVAWFTYAKGVQGNLHRPTFDTNVRILNAPQSRVPYEFIYLYNAVLALGAWVRGDKERCTQFLHVAWASLASRPFSSQSLHAVQGLNLLVYPIPTLLTVKAFLFFQLGKYGLSYALAGHGIR